MRDSLCKTTLFPQAKLEQEGFLEKGMVKSLETEKGGCVLSKQKS